MVATASLDNATWLVPRLRMEGASEGPLSGLTFAAKDLFDVSCTWDTMPPLLLALMLRSTLQVKGHVTGHGNPTWRETHEAASATAPTVQVGSTYAPDCKVLITSSPLPAYVG